MNTPTPRPYSDADLRLRACSDARGPRAEAEILGPLPEPVRTYVVASAHRMMNAVGGRYSDALRSSARAYRAGHLDTLPEDYGDECGCGPTCDYGAPHASCPMSPSTYSGAVKWDRRAFR